MTRRLFVVLATCLLPLSAVGQEVDLRSPDGFISVTGEIVDFNGVMVRVTTNVGAISVPASEVICFGPACATTFAENDFGLTAEAFVDVVSLRAEEADAAAAGDQNAGRQESRQLAFATATAQEVYRRLAASFAQGSTGPVTGTVGANDKLTLEDGRGGQTVVTTAEPGSSADGMIGPVTLSGSAPIAYDGPADWLAETRPAHHLLALDAFAVLVAPNAGITAISVSELAAIFAGEVTNWAEIGGADLNILPLQLPATSPVGQAFRTQVMAPAGHSVASNVLTIGTADGLRASVRQFPGSISVLSLQDADPEVSVALAGACGLPVPARAFHALAGDYPLLFPVMAQSTNPDSTGALAALFSYGASDAAQDSIAEAGVLALRPQLQDVSTKNARLTALLDAPLDPEERVAAAAMFQLLFDADRTSISLIGGATSAPEAAWNRMNVQQLQALVADPAFAGREVILAAFTASLTEDAAGSADAIARAKTAATALADSLSAVLAADLEDNEMRLSAHGFGNVAPAACLGSQAAGAEGVRVEVWLR